MTEFKITVEATALANAIENLARAISVNGMGSTTPAVTASAPKAAITNTLAPAQQFVSAPTVPTATAPVVSVATQVPVTAPVQPSANAASTPIPTAAPTYTLDMLAAAGSALIDAGKINDLLSILSRYGVNALTELQPTVYGAVAAELRDLGAKI